jgi:hypothetical protein
MHRPARVLCFCDERRLCAVCAPFVLRLCAVSAPPATDHGADLQDPAVQRPDDGRIQPGANTMNSNTRPRPAPLYRRQAAGGTVAPVHPALRRLAGLVLRAILKPPLDARTAYLSRSVDHADLERRQRAFDDHATWPLPPLR